MTNEAYPEFYAPDGVGPIFTGEPFQRQATFKVVPGGKVILLAIDGYPLCQPEGAEPKQLNLETVPEQPKNILAGRY